MRPSPSAAFLLLFLVLLASGALAAGGQTVRTIDIIADELTSAEDVKARMSTKVGVPFSEEALDRDLRRLFRLGYVCTNIERDVVGDQIDLTVHISSKAVISAITFKGNSRVKDKDLEENMAISEGYPAQAFRIRKEMARIEDIYREKGFHFVCVDTSTKADEGKVTLVFEISEGPRVRVTDVIIEGNSSVPLKTIRKLVQTKYHRWWRPGYYVVRKIEEDVENISRYYRSKGWLDVEVTASTTLSGDNSVISTIYRISEGTRYSTGKVSVSGNEIFDSETLMTNIQLAEGKPFDIAVLGGDISRLRSYYTSRGYMLTQVTPKQRPEEEEPVVDIEFRIKEGLEVTIEKIDISGNEKTRDEVIRRELTFYPGETFDSQKIHRSRRAVMNTQLFANADILYEEGSAPDLAKVSVEVEEKKTGQFMFGAGYSSNDQVSGFVRLTQSNFDARRWPGPASRLGTGKAFVGDGQSLRFNVKTGTEHAEYGFDFSEPWIFNRPIGWGFGLYSQEAYYSEYDVFKVGGYTSLNKRIGQDALISLRYRSESADMDDVDTVILPVIGDEAGKNILSGLELSGTIDTRDNKNFPTYGYRLRLGYEYVGGDLGGDLDFLKSTAHCDWYTKLFETKGGKPHVLALSAGVDWAEEFSGTSNVPIYERYYAGGIRTVRGYEHRTLGPRFADEVIGGNLRLVMNVEYAFPVYEDVVYGVLFHDSGEVWADDGDFDAADLRRSVGIGVRFKTPVFPVELYYGWALDELPGEPSGRFDFAFGYMF